MIDHADRILLVRHTYRQGWHFPGGGVEKNETLETALTRELCEEAGVIPDGSPRLFGIYANFSAFPSDHIALFVIDAWHQPQIPPANKEIAEQRFFSLSDFPDDTTRPVRRRVDEIFNKRTPDQMW